MTDATPLASEQITQEDRFSIYAVAQASPSFSWPERQAVTEEAIDAALGAYVPGGARVFAWLPMADGHTIHQTARDVMRAAIAGLDKHRAALSATPAPSDQDASQAQGEVEQCARVADRWAESEEANGEGGGRVWAAALGIAAAIRLRAPAPGATAQDGDACTCQRFPTHQANDCPQHGLEPPFDGVSHDDAAHTIAAHRPQMTEAEARDMLLHNSEDAIIEAMREWGFIRATSPTPTISAGMVAHTGKTQPDDWDQQAPIMFRDGEVVPDWSIACDERWHNTGANSDIIAYTPLAAAPKQAEQQGVERARPFSEWHEDHGDVLWWKLPISEAPYVGSPLDLGRTMKVMVQVGREEHDLPFTNTGGWPFDDEDEPNLWWTPLPSPTFFHAAALNAPTGAVEKERGA